MAHPAHTATASRRLLLRLGIVLLAAVAVLAAIFIDSTGSRQGGATTRFPYVVGEPGPGRAAPGFRLASTAGGAFHLAETRGSTTLLYFMEGVMCQPCWDQLKDIERNFERFRALGIDRIVSIDCDSVGVSRRKLADEGLSSDVLFDPHRVMLEYRTNEYGMMGDGMSGHSFVLVGPDGVIRWRADYGGRETGYTMYVPVESLLLDIREGLARARA